jgi:hypothetical protein
LGKCFRSRLRMLLDIMSGELTYSPKAGFVMHSGVVSPRCVIHALDAAEQESPQQVPEEDEPFNSVATIAKGFGEIADCDERERRYGHTNRAGESAHPAAFGGAVAESDSVGNDFNTVGIDWDGVGIDTARHHPAAFAARGKGKPLHLRPCHRTNLPAWTEPARRYRGLLRTAVNTSRTDWVVQNHNDDSELSDGPQPAPSPLPLPTRHAWYRGIPDVPESLRDWDPGVDSFGVPWLSITRHPKAVRAANIARAEASPLLRGRHGFGADPNIKSFYDAYLARTGCVVDIGRGWSQRMLDGPCRNIKRQQSTRDNLLQDEIARLTRLQTATVDTIRTGTTQSKQRWLANPQHPYRLAQDAIDAAWVAVDKDQSRLHEVTCIFMTAFDDRVLPWLDTAQLFREKGVDSLSHSAKLRMAFVAHGKFRQRLISHCGDPCHRSNRIVWTTEEWSSKLCGRCHRYCGYLGNSRTFKCPHCRAHMDRDGNAARNIWMWAWLRTMHQTGSVAVGAWGDEDGGGTETVTVTAAAAERKTKRQKTIRNSGGGGGGAGGEGKGRKQRPNNVQPPSCTLTAFGVKALLASLKE